MRRGLVHCTDVAQAGKPDKKVYRLTDAGRAKLDAAIPLWEDAQRFVAEHLGPGSMESLRALADDIASLTERR